MEKEKGAILHENFPLIDVDDNVALCRNGDVVVGYSLDYPETGSLSEQGYDRLLDTFERAFRELPIGTIVHKKDIFLERPYSYPAAVFENHFQKETAHHFNGRPYLEHTGYIYFIYSSDNFLKHKGIWNPFKKFPPVEEVLSSARKGDTFLKSVGASVGLIEQSGGISLRPLRSKSFYKNVIRHFTGHYPDRSVNSMRDGTDYYIGKKKVGAVYLNSQRQLPDRTKNLVLDARMSRNGHSYYRGLTEGLGMDIFSDHIINHFIFIDDHHAIKKEVEKKRELFHATRKFSRENQIASEKLDSYLSLLANDDSRKLVRMHYNISFLSSKEDFDEKETLLVNGLKQLDIKPMIPTGEKLQSIYLNSHFALASHIPIGDTFVTELGQALCFYQYTGPQKSDDDGVLFNERSFNLPIKVDTWGRTKARNFFIVAPTGGGKSFLANHILRQLFEEGHRSVIVDLGGSYEKLTALLESISPDTTRYIRYKPGEAIGINPFEGQGGKISGDGLQDLAEFILRLWRRGEPVAENVKVSLRKVLSLFASAIKKDTTYPNSLQGFYDYVAYNKRDIHHTAGIEPEFFPVEEFLHNTGEFTEGGAYGYLFRKAERFSGLYEKRFVVFELEEAKDDPLLVSILMQAIGQTVQRLIWGNKGERGTVFFDEFAKLLQYPGVLASVEYYYQAIRKQEGAVGVVLQSPNQLPMGSTSASIIDNTPILYVLKNERGYDDICTRFGLDGHARMLLGTMQGNLLRAPYYTEFFMQRGTTSHVYRLEVPEALRLAYMTDGEENAKLMAYKERSGEDMQTVIRKYMETDGQVKRTVQ